MKKFTFLAIGICGFLFANAQRVVALEVKLDKLAEGETIKTMVGFTPQVSVKNLGPDPLLQGDTLYLLMGLNKQYSSQVNNLTTYGPYVLTIQRDKDSMLYFNNLNGLSLQQSVPGGAHTFCALVIATQQNNDLATVTDEQCNNITVINNTSVFGNGGLTAFNANVYPNPATSNATISFGSEVNKPYSVQVFDLAGREVANFNGVTSSDLTELNVDMNNLTSGLYTYQLNLDGMTAAGKIVKN